MHARTRTLHPVSVNLCARTIVVGEVMRLHRRGTDACKGKNRPQEVLGTLSNWLPLHEVGIQRTDMSSRILLQEIITWTQGERTPSRFASSEAGMRVFRPPRHYAFGSKARASGHTEGTSPERKRGTAPNSAHDLHASIRTQRATCGHLPRRRIGIRPLTRRPRPPPLTHYPG